MLAVELHFFKSDLGTVDEDLSYYAPMAVHPPSDLKPETEGQKDERKVLRNPDGSVTEVIEAPGKPKIIIHRRPGMRIFGEPVKCPLGDCNMYFATDYDLRCHLEMHWKPLKNGGGEWIESEAFPYLCRALLNAKYVIRGEYEYRLTADGKIIVRKKRTLF